MYSLYPEFMLATETFHLCRNDMSACFIDVVHYLMYQMNEVPVGIIITQHFSSWLSL